MRISFKNNEVQAKLWSIPGPFFISLILLTVVLRRSSTSFILPLIAVSGIVLCHFWKWRGVALASVLLAGVMLFSLQSQPSQFWIWPITLSLSIASAFVVSVLCAEEAEAAQENLSKDFNDHKQMLAHLNDRFQAVQNKFAAEQNALNQQIGQLQQQLNAKEEKQRGNEQLIRLARHEIVATYEQQEKLMQELFQSRQAIAEKEAKIDELKELVNPETADFYGKAVVQGLQSQLEVSSAKIEQLNHHLREIEAQELLARQGAEKLTKEIASLKQEHALAAEAKIHENHAKIQELESRYQGSLQEFNARLTTFNREKQELESMILSLQEELENTSLQELEKSELLEKEQAALQALQSAFDEEKNIFNDQIKELESRLQSYADQNEKLNDLQAQMALEQNEVQKLVRHCETLASEKAALEENYTSAKEKESHLLRGMEELVQQLKEMDKLGQEHHDAQQKIAALQKLEHENQELLHKLAHQNEQIALMNAEKTSLEEQLKVMQPTSTEPSFENSDREVRRMEGLYQQLRQQFAEKSELLSATRRELFITQEKLTALQKEMDEAQLYGDSEASEPLHHLIVATENELALSEKLHAIEIHNLHEVIEALITAPQRNLK